MFFLSCRKILYCLLASASSFSVTCLETDLLCTMVFDYQVIQEYLTPKVVPQRVSLKISNPDLQGLQVTVIVILSLLPTSELKLLPTMPSLEKKIVLLHSLTLLLGLVLAFSLSGLLSVTLGRA